MGLVLALVLLFASPGQAQNVDPPVLDDHLDRKSLRAAIKQSLNFLDKIPPGRFIGEFPRRVTAQEVKDSLLLFLHGLDTVRRTQDFANWVKSRFDVHPAGATPNKILFTGYYRPVLRASFTASDHYRFPIYGKPKDLVEADLVTLFPERQVGKVVGRVERDQWLPYFSRAEIDRDGRLKGQDCEIAWTDDPIALYFLHVQGSGVLRFENGALTGISYAASNGRAYRSIGRILVDQGKMALEEVTMQRLARYLRDHPEERDALLYANERYVFFRFAGDAATGSLGVPLTAGRSIATDARIFPHGALAFVATREPVIDPGENPVGWKPVRRFVLNQDTGAAIEGPARVDLYFGTGARAGAAAGVMKSMGDLYFLLKKRP